MKDGYFELLDAVSAIEIMDPKMDSGVLGPGEDSLDEEYDLSRKLDGREVVGIIDQLLCLEVSSLRMWALDSAGDGWAMEDAREGANRLNRWHGTSGIRSRRRCLQMSTLRGY